MVFTVVTIFFVSCDVTINFPLYRLLIRTKLPLSFMSSLFGMNTKEFGGDDNVMHLGDQFRYISKFSSAVR